MTKQHFASPLGASFEGLHMPRILHPDWSRLTMKNDQRMKMKTTCLQLALRISRMGTGAKSPPPPLPFYAVHQNPPNLTDCSWPGSLSPPIGMSEYREGRAVGCVYTVQSGVSVSLSLIGSPVGATQSLCLLNVYHSQSVCMRHHERDRVVLSKRTYCRWD